MMRFLIGFLFVLLSLWLALAFVSDVMKITEFKLPEIRFIIIASLFCSLLMTASLMMLLKYSRNKEG
jgi:hypothetical protein